MEYTTPDYKRVKYTQKALQHLDATLPFLVLTDGSILSNFTYMKYSYGTYIIALTEFDVPFRPSRMWNFEGEDLTTYYNAITHVEYDANLIRTALLEVEGPMSEAELEVKVLEFHKMLESYDDGICSALEMLDEAYAAEKAEGERRNKFLQDIADATANDPDALPSPEVMQMRIDESNKVLDAAFSDVGTTSNEIEVVKPSIITSLNEAPKETPKIIL